MLRGEMDRNSLAGSSVTRMLLCDVDRPVENSSLYPSTLKRCKTSLLEELFKDARDSNKDRRPHLFQIFGRFVDRLGVVHAHAVAEVNVHSSAFKNMRERQDRQRRVHSVKRMPFRGIVNIRNKICVC